MDKAHRFRQYVLPVFYRRYFKRFFASFEQFKSEHSEDICIALGLQFYYDDFSLTLKKKGGGMYMSVVNMATHTANNKRYR